ncbi:MAG: transglutaminase-like domain-containing protein [Rubritalea sp.]|uniref:transglutaminase-like domain-containing protein n=1 Tax=Rubritalea sp. TaxID=2109375 RepID=UPI003242BA46
MAVLLLGFFLWGAWLKDSHLRFSAVRKPRLSDYTLVLALVLVVELVSMAAVAVSTEVVLFSDTGILREGRGPRGSAEDGEWLWDQEFEREIPKNSDHKPPSRPEVYCEVLDGESLAFLMNNKVYLRGFAFDAYRRDSWRSSKRVKKIIKGDGIGVELDQPVENLPQVNYRLSLNPGGTGQDVALAMQGGLRIEVSKLRQIAKGVLLLPESDAGSIVYKGISQPRTLKSITALDSQIRISQPGRSYLQLPVDFAMRKRWNTLLVDLKNETELAVQLEGIRKLLAERCRYSLKVENPRNLGSMENFLFAERRGYCEHFASAAALLCRELGIPSRVAYGYSGGTLYPYSKLIVFRSRDAHAWTEIYLDGYGWTVFDTTPSDETTMQTASEGDTPPALEEVSPEEKPQRISMITWWSVCGGGLAVIVGSLLVALLKSKEEAKQASRLIGNGQAPAAYLEAFQDGCRAAGVRSVDSLTLKELMGRLPEKLEFADELEIYHNGVTYRKAMVSKSTEKVLLQKIQKWAAN